jgi:hypothetical protein
LSEQRPDFLIVCDHGINGGDLDEAGLLPWFADRPGWWVAEGIHEHIKAWLMEGAQRGWDPWLMVQCPEPADDPRREAIEIPCPASRCTRRAYRSDGDKLNTLLTTIAGDHRFRDVFAVHADESVIVIKLERLHMARDLAKRHGLLV